ncbi:MAG TPA: cation:proton antiporter [Candidatus Alistipes avicola]|uniref:Cation:proton antiporter n=1 Tax=Candidatus Alistipes avicola TaxID=2838432 RepID=A0A9D2IDQ2_9BACT|nr:cation:proton antiporter [uncultured Alistipes sp.]HJA98207.1 cation:proton antiporter [Candidatus Alistipes avicola]
MNLLFSGITLPLEDPILKFLLILVIILAAPLLLNKLKIPYLLGLIIAGAVIGPHGLNLVLRDSSIILSGTAGLLYIMFLSGLDMDMSDFKRSSRQSLVFGLYTFCIPLALGILAGYYILGFSIYSSILLAGLFASQTLIAYPIVSKLGIARDKAVTIAVGGTVITDTLALLLLTVIVGMVTGNVDDMFWWRLAISVVLCVAIIILLFPVIAHWFFKHCTDNISQYIFVLVMVFLGAYLAHLAGLEPIIGAFLAGLALNRLIPRTSPLMNRIEFVGHAIFIPFFLIGVGMLIDYRAFFRDWESLKVAAVMIVLITAAKYLAALLTQKTFRLSADQRTVIFGLSSAHVAATLAAVMVGYNIILGHTPDGEPIRLLGDSVLNGTILMILATCTISTFATQRGAHNIAVKGMRTDDQENEKQNEHILIPISNEESAAELIALGNQIKSPKNHNEIYALHAIDNKAGDTGLEKRGQKVLETAASIAAASDIYLHELLRYDVNISNAIASVARERNITDIIMGLHRDKSPSVFIGKITGDLLTEANVTTYIYKPAQPLTTLKRHIVIIPPEAEKEAGFPVWLQKIRNLSQNGGVKIVIYASQTTLHYLEPLRRRKKTEVETVLFNNWDKLQHLLREIHRDECLWLVMSRRDRVSYHPIMSKVPSYLDSHLQKNSFVLIYPMQAGTGGGRYL